MLSKSVSISLFSGILVLSLGCRKEAATVPSAARLAKKTKVSEEVDEDSPLGEAGGGAFVDVEGALFRAPFRLTFKSRKSSPKGLEVGQKLSLELNQNSSQPESLARRIVAENPSALTGFMNSVRSRQLTEKQAELVLQTLAFMPEEEELSELFLSLKPTALGRLAERQLLSLKDTALQFLTKKINDQPQACPAPTYRICKRLLTESDFAVVNSLLMNSRGPGAWSILELALSIESRTAQRRIKEHLFFGDTSSRLLAMKSLQSSPTPLFSDFLRTQLDFNGASQPEESRSLKVEAIRTLAHFRDVKVIPKLMNFINENDKALSYESLKALKVITLKQKSKKEWLQWWQEYGPVHANIEQQRMLALDPRAKTEQRVTAIRNMSQFLDESITRTLVALFIDLDEDVQLEAIRQSAYCPEADVAFALVRLLDSKRDLVVRSAHLALQRVTKQKYGRSKAAWVNYLKKRLESI